ncbi:MAG TPA: hypothetical protein VK961_27305 [Chthoniobacter sp.]|nr:hypothetical protein [Chthoniobacter sp.]
MLKLLIRIRDCFRNVCVDKVGHRWKQGDRSLSNGRYPLSPSGVLLPETCIAAKYVLQQIARIAIALGKRILLQPLERQWQEILQPDLLADHDAQIFDGKFAKRNATQAMALNHGMRVEIWLAPVVTFELLQ